MAAQCRTKRASRLSAAFACAPYNPKPYMAPITITPIRLSDRVRLRKPHACGGHGWVVVRVGADIGLKCETCGRRVLLTRRDFERRLDRLVTPLASQNEQHPGADGHETPL